MRERCTIDGRQVHATLKNEPAFDVDVSKHTAEGGSAFIDHARPQQIVLSMDIVCSDADPDAFSNGTDAQSMHAFLYDLSRNPRPVPVSTPRTTFDALLLQSYRPKAESRYASALHASLAFVEWKTSQLVAATIEVRQAKQVKKGLQPSKKPPPSQRSAIIAAGQATGDVSDRPEDRVVRGADGVLRKGAN